MILRDGEFAFALIPIFGNQLLECSPYTAGMQLGEGVCPEARLWTQLPAPHKETSKQKDFLYWTPIFMNCPLNVHCFPPQSTTEGALKTLASIGLRGMEPWAPFVLKSPTPSMAVFVHRVLDKLIKNLWSSGNRLRWVVYLLRRERTTRGKGDKKKP